MARSMSPSQPPPADREGPEPGSAPGAPPGTRRPRYLVVALVAALVFGAGCWTEGCGRLGLYHGQTEQHARLTSVVEEDDHRAEAERLYQRFVDASDDARGRAFPLAAATFVLGAALLALAARGLAGRSNNRSALMQVVSAQAIVMVASYFLTRDMLHAEADLQYGVVLMQQREHLPAHKHEPAAAVLGAMRRYGTPGWLVFRTVASALIVVALSRPRARDFFETAGRPVSER